MWYSRSWVAAACLAVAGCGSADGLPGVVPVRGTVTLDGEPLPSGDVLYLPTDPAGRQARGSIDERGQFRLSTLRPNDGALPGEYRIVVLAPAEESAEDAAARRANENAGRQRRTFSAGEGPASLAPLRYTKPETSGLTDIVGDDHSGTILLELSSEAAATP